MLAYAPVESNWNFFVPSMPVSLAEKFHLLLFRTSSA